MGSLHLNIVPNGLILTLFTLILLVFQPFWPLKSRFLTKFEALELWEPQNRIQRKILHGLKKKAGL